ncbi:MAG: putative major capsid protein [Microviridae sp.]|nr:MAG: putative major capsid protein [Microviridae sp.]
MARQSTTPVQFNKSRRTDDSVLMTSGRAGRVQTVAYIPLLRGDSASGRVGIDIDLAEMPKPLLNAVQANVQAWFVPKSCFPQFPGMDEFRHAYQGGRIKSLGAPDRDPPKLFNLVSPVQKLRDSDFAKGLGLHFTPSNPVNTDVVDAAALVYNFRLAAHSSRLQRKSYCIEDLDDALELPRAFWPTGRFSRVVPDYERALIVGSLDLDVAAGQIPIEGISRTPGQQGTATATYTGGPDAAHVGAAGKSISFDVDEHGESNIFAAMTGQSIGVTLADIDKARTTQAFAKLRTAYAGNDATGFDNDDAIVADLMQGFQVDPEEFNRPMLLDSSRVTFGMSERHATDAANLDASVTTGLASATLSLNVPRQETGGIIIVTVEVLPERIDERMSDEYWHISKSEQLPDALRDVQRPEPVDLVINRRIDARHTAPDGLYGYEAMNDVWNRATTRLGGSFYQADPTNPFKEQRSAIWQTSIVDPTFTDDHWLAPADFPHSVFSDTQADAYELVCRHSVAITGLTQIGDVLSESNDDYEAVRISEE